MKNAKSKSPESKLIEVKLPANALEIGMHVTRLDRPWIEVPVLLQGLTISGPEDIELLNSYCEYVYIEIEKEFWLETGKPLSKEKTFPGFQEKEDIHKVLPAAKFTYEQTQQHVDEVLTSISNGERFDMDASRKAIQACVKNIMRNANALLWLTQIKEQDQYTSEHCLRVGILAIAFGRFLGMSEPDLELLGLCGMLHDVGKLKVPDEILNKPGRLSRIEFDIMKQHAVFGKEILASQKGADTLIIETAHYHHERIDGKGYPHQLNARYLHKFIRMITIVDAYDAITSSRAYKNGAPAFDALKILFSERDMHFDSELTEAFIRMVGIYPPGTLVEMTNGEVGIVISANPDARLRPKVELVMTSEKKFRAPYVINLAETISDKSGKAYMIKQGLANGTYGVDVSQYIMK
jgi:putative nucleotidyltransferase with HDIG domain